MPVYPTAAVEWAQARGLDVFHPVTWSERHVQAFIRFKLGVFRETWRLHRSTGMVDILRKQGGREALISAVRSDLHDALSRPPTRMVVNCPCHPHGFTEAQDEREPHERITPDEVDAWIARDPFRRQGLQRRTAAELAWLDREFGHGPARGAGGARDVAGPGSAGGGGLAAVVSPGRSEIGSDDSGAVAQRVRGGSPGGGEGDRDSTPEAAVIRRRESAA